jgi:phosphoglycerate dehydrogenase-like enzyme
LDQAGVFHKSAKRKVASLFPVSLLSGFSMPSANRPKAIFVSAKDLHEEVYGPEEVCEIGRMTEILAEPMDPAEALTRPDLLAEAEVIFSTWGGPRFDEAFLAQAPRLRAVFYGAGSIRHLVTDAFWDREISISSAAAINAEPVAEFALATIILGLKGAWPMAMLARERKGPARLPSPGNFRATVGLVSFGVIARRLRDRLRSFDHRVLVYDPLLSSEEAAVNEVEKVELEELFAASDAVSVHTPWLKETEGLITGSLIASIRPNGIFINTARGAVVREDEMIEALQARPDLMAYLDVTYPEPPVPESPLYTLPNVLLTPHIAGAIGLERRRLGQAMVEECRRWLAGKPLRWEVTRQRAALMA